MEMTEVLLLSIAVGIWVLVFLWVYGMFFIKNNNEE